MTQLRARAFWIPKEGNRVDEWEDAFAYSESRLQLALSDGAGSSYRAHDWAAALVNQFLVDPPKGTAPAAVESWAGECAQRFDEVPVESDDSWYVDEATRRGAFATFLGLGMARAQEPEMLAWVSIAVGDTCLFHVRDGKRLLAFPLDDPEHFTVTPALLCSAEREAGRGGVAVIEARGTCLPGDVFLMLTDAFAKWALQAEREDPDVWLMLASLQNESFLSLMTHLRGAGAIENDDVTLLRAIVGTRTRRGRS